MKIHIELDEQDIAKIIKAGKATLGGPIGPHAAAAIFRELEKVIPVMRAKSPKPKRTRK